MMNKIEDFKCQALEKCNSQLSRISEGACWQRFEDIDVIDQSYYDIYDQEAWDIYIFSNCGLSHQASRFSKCQLSLKDIVEHNPYFEAAQDLFHSIIEIRREYEYLLNYPDSSSVCSQDDDMF